MEFKRRVVAEASTPGVSVSSVARRYDLNANQVFNWRRRYGGEGTFLPVVVTGAASVQPAAGAFGGGDGAAGEIEMVLAAGHRVTIRGVFDPEVLARLLRGLLS